MGIFGKKASPITQQNKAARQAAGNKADSKRRKADSKTIAKQERKRDQS